MTVFKGTVFGSVLDEVASLNTGGLLPITLIPFDELRRGRRPKVGIFVTLRAQCLSVERISLEIKQ